MSIDHDPATWDRAADGYSEVAEPITAQFAEEALRLAGISPGMRVLDVAAGGGALALPAARLGAQVEAIDFSTAMIAQLERRLATEGAGGIAARVMDGQALDYPDESFHRAFSIFGLIFFPDRHKGLTEMRRVLKPGGYGIITAWGAPERQEFPALFREAVMQAAPDFQPGPPPDWFQLQHTGRLLSEMQGAGFRGVAIHTVRRLWPIPSAQWLWERASGASPVCATILASFAPEVREAVGRAFLKLLRDKYGEVEFSLGAEAHIAVGVK